MRSTGARYYGKVLGGLLGFALLRHPIGLLLGAVLGHALDSGWLRRRAKPAASTEAYAVLGVSPQASDEDIDRAYRRLMSKYHPDRLVGVEDSARARAEARASAINAAYDRIMLERRKARDRT